MTLFFSGLRRARSTLRRGFSLGLTKRQNETVLRALGEKSLAVCAPPDAPGLAFHSVGWSDVAEWDVSTE
jgi:hypothetical protein